MTFAGKTIEECLDKLKTYEDVLKASCTNALVATSSQKIDTKDSLALQECDKKIKEGEIIVQGHERRSILRSPILPAMRSDHIFMKQDPVASHRFCQVSRSRKGKLKRRAKQSAVLRRRRKERKKPSRRKQPKAKAKVEAILQP